MIDTVLEPSTQTPVDLTGLSPEERLYAAMCEHVDPKTYDGLDGATCLIGQVGRAMVPGCDDEADETWEVADYFGVSLLQVERIYGRAASDHPHNLPAALAMAREELGLPEKPG